MFRRLKPYQLGFDVGLAVLCVGLRVPLGAPEPALTVVVVGMGLAFALRRLSPPLALATAWVFAVAQLSFALQPDVANLALLPVLYATARYGGRLVKWAGLISAALGAVLASLYLTVGVYYGSLFGETGPPNLARFTITFLAYLFAAMAALVLSWTLGLLAKTWANAQESRMRQLVAEHNVAVEQQRNRIARDMHDIVAHSLAVVIAQADGARYAMSADPGAAESALGTISDTARAALADVRVLLGELRHDEPTAPQPSLGDVPRLVDQLRASGLSVDFDQSGTPRSLPPGSQLAVYRIAQEALSNALRHGAPGGLARVRLHWQPTALELTVTSKRAAGPARALRAGHGIHGMRERAALAGGELTIVDGEDEFVVRATIPVPESAAVGAAPDRSGRVDGTGTRGVSGTARADGGDG